jgi:type VII secretion-associated serine protease mycosin
MRQRAGHRLATHRPGSASDVARSGDQRWVRRAAASIAIVVAALVAVLPYAPTPAAATCTPAPQIQSPSKPTQPPWPQQRWGFDRLAALGVNGKDVRVAVIDSGVDAQHPQLSGAVKDGWDAFGSSKGQEDCVGHGTGVASLIAAQPVPGTPFRGLAPGAKILSLRASERTDGNDNGRGNPDNLADAINEAVKRQAQVINLSLMLTEDNPAVRAAIKRALANNVVVVAAVGNFHNTNGGKDPTPYPAAYEGVIGVGAIGENGQRYAQSQTGDYVKLVAPGDQIYAAAPGNGYQILAGTSMAAPFVAATAALIIDKYGPNISPREVANRLIATTDPAPGEPGSPEYGQGVVNPYRAVTAIVTNDAPAKLPPLPRIRHDPKAEAAAAAAGRRHVVALWLAGVVGGVALIVVLVAVVVPAGRQRGWRPGT